MEDIKMKNIFAEYAKKLVAHYKAEMQKNEQLTYSRERVLDNIMQEAAYGNTFLVLDIPHVQLNDSDYEFFESLGYKVTKPKYTYYVPANRSLPTKLPSNCEIVNVETTSSTNIEIKFDFGVISWEE